MIDVYEERDSDIVTVRPLGITLGGLLIGAESRQFRPGEEAAALDWLRQA